MRFVMRLVRQILVSLIVLVVGVAAILRFSPTAREQALGFGVPSGWVGLIAELPPAEKAGAPDSAKAGKDGAKAEPAKAAPGEGRRRGPSGPALVVVEPVRTAAVNDRLKAIGNGEAVQSVTVTPSVNGVLAEIVVKSGDRVKAGEVLARLVSDNEALAVDQAKVALKAAEDNLARNKDLKAIVSRADLAKAETDAESARLDLARADLDLKNRTILAPISGVVGIVTVTAGDVVTTQTALATIDDRSRLIVDFWVPERFAATIKVGDAVAARAVAAPGSERAGQVSAIDSRIDEASRTLHVQATIDNGDDALRAGMAFGVEMRFAGQDYPAVNPLAVQWDSQGAYVWTIRDKKAARVSVTIIERNADSVLVSGPLAVGDVVVVEGLQRVRPGAEVQIAGEDQAKPGQGT